MADAKFSNITIPIILSILHRFSSTLFGFLNFFILARILTKTELGIWSIFLFIVAAFEMSKSSLLKNAHIRLILTSKEEEKDKHIIAGSSLLVNIAFTVLFISFILIFSPYVSHWLNTDNQFATMLKYYIPGLVAMIYFSHYEAVQQSNHNFKNGFTANFIRQFIFFILILFHFLNKIDFDLITLVWYYSIGNFIGTLVFYFISRQFISYNFKYSGKSIKEILNFGGFMMGGNIISQISANLDQLLVARFISSGTVGYYGIASRVMYAVEIPMNGVSEALFPSFTKASKEGNNEVFNSYLEKSIGSLLALLLPIVIVLIIFSGHIINIIAGPNYIEGKSILQIYLLMTLINVFKHQASNTLLSLGKSQIHFIITISQFVLSICLIYLSIANFNTIGPAYARLTLSVLSLLIWIFLMKKLIGINLGNIFRQIVIFYPNLISTIKVKS
jgi:lipopolysaccharide exporter